MDRQQDFQGWEKTVKKWNSSRKNIKLFSDVNKGEEPNLYKVVIINDQNISNDLYVDVFVKFFHIDQRNRHNYLQKLRNFNRIEFGPFTREIAEHKVTSVIEYTYKLGSLLKCKMTKDEDNEYVIKKS